MSSKRPERLFEPLEEDMINDTNEESKDQKKAKRIEEVKKRLESQAFYSQKETHTQSIPNEGIIRTQVASKYDYQKSTPVNTSVDEIMKIIGVLEIISGIIGGIVAGRLAERFSVFLIWCVGGFTSGMLFYAFGTVVSLLKEIAKK